MIILLTVGFFLLGITIGSFLNVVIYRLNTNKSLGGRSACMSCTNQLSWYELIPIFSFLFLGGRCKNCKVKISPQYIFIELVAGIIFAMLFWKFQDIFFLSTTSFLVTYVYYALILSILLVVAVYDLKHKIIPDTLAFIFGSLAFVGMFFFASGGIFGVYNFGWHMPTMLEFSSGLIVAAPFALLWLVSRGKWMGLGDAKLALGIGWLLGVSSALSGVAVAFWSGSIIGIALLFISRKSKSDRIRMKSEIPFAPFLVFGTFLVFIFELNFFRF